MRNIDSDIGTEEMAHWEVIATIVYKLTKDATVEEIKAAGMGPYYANHGKGIFPESAAGVPYTAAYINAKDDPVSNLVEDMAAEQKARAVYENLLKLSDDPEVNKVLRQLWEREIVHFQRFGEALDDVYAKLNSKKGY